MADEKKKEIKGTDDILIFAQECISSGQDYRDKFKADWDEVEDQIRCVKPAAWDKKQDWQSKVFIPLQAKKEEVAISYLNKMVFGKRRFFDIVGDEKDDYDEAQALTDLIDTLLEVGGFKRENTFIITEAVGNPGTAFCKVTMRDDGYLNFIWRSAYTSLIDPACGHRLEKSRFWVDEYKKDIAYIVAEGKKGKKYASGKAEINRFLSDTQAEYNTLKEKAGQGSSTASAEGMITVKGIDDTAYFNLPQSYKMVDVHEIWAETPNAKGEYEYRVITVLNERYILRNDENPIGCLPVVGCRTKPRKYDYYGRGYLENGRGFQELSNSMVNLGFDSAKISSMDIILLDETKVKDPSSIKYMPLAVWKMKDIAGVKIQRQPMSALSDIIKGLMLIDQLDQDASGITRQAQGAPDLSGGGTQSETLGQYQLKIAAIDQRFLDQGRLIEQEYVIPLIKLIFKIIVNPALFTQDKVNKLLGFKEIDDLQEVQEPDQFTGGMKSMIKNVGKKKVVRLDLARVREKGEMAYNFKAVGITQFTDRLETIEKLKEALAAALSNPTLTAMTKIDLLWKRLFQLSDIEDYDELLRTKDELQELVDSQTQQMPMGGPPMPGAMPPMGGGQPPMPGGMPMKPQGGM